MTNHQRYQDEEHESFESHAEEVGHVLEHVALLLYDLKYPNQPRQLDQFLHPAELGNPDDGVHVARAVIGLLAAI